MLNAYLPRWKCYEDTNWKWKSHWSCILAPKQGCLKTLKIAILKMGFTNKLHDLNKLLSLILAFLVKWKCTGSHVNITLSLWWCDQSARVWLLRDGSSSISHHSLKTWNTRHPQANSWCKSEHRPLPFSSSAFRGKKGFISCRRLVENKRGKWDSY